CSRLPRWELWPPEHWCDEWQAADTEMPTAAEFKAMQSRGEFPTDEQLEAMYPPTRLPPAQEPPGPATGASLSDGCQLAGMHPEPATAALSRAMGALGEEDALDRFNRLMERLDREMPAAKASMDSLRAKCARNAHLTPPPPDEIMEIGDIGPT